MAFISKEGVTQIKNVLGNLSPGKWVALWFIVGGTILGFTLLMLLSGGEEYRVLYSNLNPQDAGQILTKLKKEKIPYKISENGKTIQIAEKDIYETRLELASQGLPQGGGVGFEIFDETKLGMTEFVQNVNYQRALQGELSRTINNLSEVQSSRVHIVMPSRSVFVEEEEPAKASVVLKFRPGQRLNEEEVQGIVHLVSSSVSGLSPEKVTVLDNGGRMLAGKEKRSTVEEISADQLTLRKRVEKHLEDRLDAMLAKSLGPDKALVSVSCALDFTKQEKTEETYQPKNQVVRSEKVELARPRNNAVASGIPGTSSNTAQNNQNSRSVTKTVQFQKENRMVNYEIGKVTSRTVEQIGDIKNLSVAVMVDGTYEEAGKNGEGEPKYIPRTPEEMEKIENIVKRAVAFRPERGDKVEVVNIPFETQGRKTAGVEVIKEKEGWLSWLRKHVPLVKYSLLAAFIAFTFLFVFRPLVKWFTGSGGRDAEIMRQLPKTVGEIESEFGGGTKQLPYRDTAAQLIASDKELSQEALRVWLSEEERA